jgi:cellulose synthase/poly-beta-1,6-N-acetylglucosamine synthase-like glycosyltransferase
MDGATRDDEPPPLDLSVLIATRSRADSLERTLRSMAAMNADDLRWELVIVDNGSTDRTPDLLREWSSRLPLRSLHVPESGQNRARNLALPGLRGRITVLSDDDVCVAPDWLRQWKEGTARWPDDAIFGGRITPRFPAGCADWIRSKRFPFRAQCFAEFEPAQSEGPYPRTPFGPNFAVRTDLLRSHPFRADLGPAAGTYAMGGETELTLRLKAHGHRVIYLPGPCVEHVLAPENLSLDKLCQRGFNAGRGDEYRRAMRGAWSRPVLWLRSNLLMPAKIGTYVAAQQLAALFALPVDRRFERQYRVHSARGRLHQLRLMLGGSQNRGASA